MKHRVFEQLREFGPRGFTAWIEPDEKGDYYIACCDCGLTHKFQFRVREEGKPRIEFRAKRAPRYTARQRAHRTKP